MCSHGGHATPTAANPRVLVSKQPTELISVPWVVAGCPVDPPCVTAQWVVGSARVTSNGQPLVIQSGTAICIPTGNPLVPVESQTRVTAE